MPSKKWKCKKCGRVFSTNGPKPMPLGCPKGLMHNWVEDSFIGPFWDRLKGKK